MQNGQAPYLSVFICILMKYLIPFLFLLLISCESKKKQTFVFLDKGIESSTLEIENLNNHYYAYAEMYYLENPKKNNTHKENIDKIKAKSELVLAAITQKFNDIKSKRRLALDTLKQKKEKLNTDKSFKKVDLFTSVRAYKNLLDSLLLKDSSIQSDYNQNGASTLFNYQKHLNWSESRLIVINTYELNLLKNKVQNISNQTIQYFISKMGKPTIRSNKIEVVVIPANKYLYSNEIYEASLYLVSLDTDAEIVVLVDNESYEAKNGKVFYEENNTNNPSTFNKKGILKLTDQHSDFSYVYPFIINYQIEEK